MVLENWLLLLILFPVICALIGYLTNVVAVKMIFRPYERFAVLGVGFQGVLPKHLRHFCDMLGGVIGKELMGPGDLVDELAKPEAIAALETAGKELAAELIEEVRATLPENKRALLTEATIDALMNQVTAAAKHEVPKLVVRLRSEAEETIDLPAIVSEKLMEVGAEGVESVLYEVSRKELRFIELYGAVFGGALGLFQYAVLWLLGDIALPIVGGVVGTVTNWLAIQMLFYPREPTRYLGIIKYQGMFPRRQHEIGLSLGKVAARDFVAPTELFHDLANRVAPETLDRPTLDRCEGWLRQRIPPLAQVVDGLLTEDEREALRGQIEQRYTSLRVEALGKLTVVAGDAVSVADLIESGVNDLPKMGFESIIRGLFEREEFYLVVYGGILGALMGGAQLALVWAL